MQTRSLQILLADDDRDDAFFFERALSGLNIHCELVYLKNGEILMKYLNDNMANLPDVLFLDLNMPRKSGTECLTEIKSSKKFKQLPVVIYSTSLRDDIADDLYNCGAHYYLRKSELDELQKLLQHILTLI